ncbi:MAG: chlorite dismutase family protein [Proteobacteria bacterium]|nr:chlorite dismutase family protein [Pseudomonadota bacterium]
MHNRFTFAGGNSGKWRVRSMRPFRGLGLASVPMVDVRPSSSDGPSGAEAWKIEGQISNLRYATRSEVTTLRSKQEPLGRAPATYASMIPIRKSQAWWDLAQDERRAIFEEASHHTAIGLGYLPAVARQLYHSRDLGQEFDFVTWFEYSPDYSNAFDDLLGKLRETREWDFIEREVEIGLELVG